MLYLIIITIFATLFSKEYFLVNDNLIIIIVFSVIFVYLISVASPVVKNHIDDVRFNMINDFATSINNIVIVEKSHFETLKIFLEYLYHIDIYLETQYDMIIESEN